jgi:2-keto-4-pentenoate hydratase
VTHFPLIGYACEPEAYINTMETERIAGTTPLHSRTLKGDGMDRNQVTSLSGVDKDRLHEASEMLLEARRSERPIDDLPPTLRPKTLEEAYFVQDLILQALGRAGGWKVGAPGPEATPLCAPMPLITFAQSGARIARQFRRLRGVEGEIAFLIGRDLPPRSAPYTRQEEVDAIASCHPAIELLESALRDPDSADRLTAIADLQTNGGFVAGAAVAGWQDFDFADESAQMNVDGFVRVENGKNSAGSDLLRLVVWLANEAQNRTGGLRAGQWITTGSWTGKILAESGSVAVARFPHFGEVSVTFE